MPTANSLTIEEVCRMIEVCAKASVRRIEFGELRLEFGEFRPASLDRPTQEAPELTTPTEAALSEMHDKQNEETLGVEEARTKEDRLALMLIEDPLQAEELITNGEIDFTEEDDDDAESSSSYG